MAGRFGSMEKGKFADAIAVTGDPLKDITELERAKFVMKGGQVIRDDSKQSGEPPARVFALRSAMIPACN